jgi:hypothetical protein
MAKSIHPLRFGCYFDLQGKHQAFDTGCSYLPYVRTTNYRTESRAQYAVRYKVPSTCTSIPIVGIGIPM